MGDNLILYERDGAVAVITLNRPDAMNALDMAMGHALAAVAERARFDQEARVVILTGAGRAFSAGGDLKAMKTNIDTGGDPGQFLRDLTKVFHPAVIDLRLMEKPVIAAINGPAGGAGFSLALVCDLRFVADTAFFQQAYTAIGLVPDGGMSLFLPRIVGLGAASELVFLNPRLDARRALQLGLVHEVVPAEALMTRVMEVSHKLAAGPAAALGKAKQLLNRSMLATLEGQLEAERQTIATIGTTADFREGLTAFLEKRPPAFKGEKGVKAADVGTRERKTHIIGRLAAERQALLMFLEDLKDDDWALPTDNDQWTVRDLLAHLVGAEVSQQGLITLWLEGNTGMNSEFDLDRWNAAQLRRRQKRNPLQLMGDLVEARRETLKLLDRLSEEQLDIKGEHPFWGPGTSIEQVIRGIYRHERLHLGDMQQALD